MLTEINALEITIKLFQDIYDNAYFYKPQSQYYSVVKFFRGGCALCEYHKPLCNQCCLNTFLECESYNRWCNKDIEGAKDIVDTCTNRLKELEKQ